MIRRDGLQEKALLWTSPAQWLQFILTFHHAWALEVGFGDFKKRTFPGGTQLAGPHLSSISVFGQYDEILS